MTSPRRFVNPPIVELVLGVQFSRLTKFSIGQFGLFWKEHKDQWTGPSDGPLIEDQFELFDEVSHRSLRGGRLRIVPAQLPVRFLLGHKDGSPFANPDQSLSSELAQGENVLSELSAVHQRVRADVHLLY